MLPRYTSTPEPPNLNLDHTTNNDMSTPEILAAYRRLYKSFLRAVQYRVPERYVGRDQLRASFRDMPATAPAYTAANGLGAGVYDAVGIKRTYWLFQAAAKERGLEAQIVKNLLRVQLRAATKKPTWRRRWLDEKQK